MIIAATVAILVVMILASIRGIIGPTFYDRILAVNMIGTKTILLLSLLGFVMGRPEFLDIAIVYALINFISVIGVLRYSDSFEFKQGMDSLPEIEPSQSRVQPSKESLKTDNAKEQNNV